MPSQHFSQYLNQIIYEQTACCFHCEHSISMMSKYIELHTYCVLNQGTQSVDQFYICDQFKRRQQPPKQSDEADRLF